MRFFTFSLCVLALFGVRAAPVDSFDASNVLNADLPAPACNSTSFEGCLRSLEVQTANGPVIGVLRELGLKRGVEAFYGLPFGNPPVGDKRFRAPEPLSKTWSLPRLSLVPGPSCPQFRIDKNDALLLGEEDCLYLNVYKPQTATPESNLPVMVWVYGGGYVVGDGWEFGLYDGVETVARHDVILVTVNYRLSVLGFLALDELQEEDPDHGTGNYALLDQRLGLQWVQKNIRNFGGNPNQVTLFGESAGAFSTIWHLAAPGSAGLFHAAIVESGTSEVSWFFQNQTEAVEFYHDYSEYLGCPRNISGGQLPCLRKLPFKDFIIPFSSILEDMAANIMHLPLPHNIPGYSSPLYPLMPFGPVVDHATGGLSDSPFKMIEKGIFNKVPIIIGSNKDDGSIFEPTVAGIIPDFPWPTTPEGVERAMSWFMDPSNVSRALDMYPAEEFASASFPSDQRVSHTIRDIVFECTNMFLATQWAEHGVPVYAYDWAFDLGLLAKETHLDDFHASELPFVFHNFLPEIELLGIKGAFEISDKLQSWWTNFATCHNPNGCSSETSDELWPEYKTDEKDSREYLVIASNPVVKTVRANNTYPDDEWPSDEKCAFWDAQTLPWHRIKQHVLSLMPWKQA